MLRIISILNNTLSQGNNNPVITEDFFGSYDETILPKAAPITTATAKSRTFPFEANSLNSLKNFFIFSPQGYYTINIFIFK